MISFESDYNNGMLPEILENLSKTNDDKTSGYGFDPYSESAKKKIQEYYHAIERGWYMIK